MRVLAIIAVILLWPCSVARAKCEWRINPQTGQCEQYCDGSDWQAPQTQQAPQPQQPGQPYVAPQQPLPPWCDARIVRIRNMIGNGEFCYLSGAIIDVGGDKSYIASCAHGMSGKGDPVLIIFSDGRTTEVADIVAIDPPLDSGGSDCSIAKLRGGPRSDAFELAQAGAVRGETYYLAGFPGGDNGRLRIRSTIYKGQDNHGAYEFKGQAIPGESGGPILDRSGRLVGVIHSCVTVGSTAYNRGQRAAFGCPLHYVQGLLDGILPGRPGAIIPRRDQMPWSSGQRPQIEIPDPSKQPPLPAPPHLQAPPLANDPPRAEQPGGLAPPRQPPIAQQIPDPNQQVPPDPSLAERAGNVVSGASSLKWWLGAGTSALGPIGAVAGLGAWLATRRLKKRLTGKLEDRGLGSVTAPFRRAAA